MSIKATYNLYCDECGAWDPYDTTGLNVIEVRIRATRRGWVYPIQTGHVDDHNARDLCPACWAKREKEEMERERDEAYQVIDESHRMIVDEDTGRRWKELFREAEEQIAKLQKQRRVGAEAVRELFGIADIVNSFPEAPRSDGHEGALGRRVKGLIEEQRKQLADERHDHGTTKRLLAEEATKRWKLQQALEAVANTECTNGRHFCKYCNSYTDETHRDYCVVAPVLGLPIETRASDE